jgi:hypothetical protein
VVTTDHGVSTTSTAGISAWYGPSPEPRAMSHAGIAELV